MIYFFLLVVFFYGIGLLIINKLDLPKSPLIAGSIGFSIVSVFATILYKFGVPLKIQCLIFWVISFLALWPYRGQILKSLISNKIISVSTLFVTFLLILPYYTGGRQFYSFQGNHWDNFSYLGSSIGYANNSYDELVSKNKEDLVNSPVTIAAKRNLKNRPSINIVHALTSFFSFKNFIDSHYIFLLFLWLLTFHALVFGLHCVFKLDELKSSLVSAAFVVGFFGQYILDINAWSHIGGFAQSVALVLLSYHILVNKQKMDKNTSIILGAIASGLFYIYPEILLFHGPFFVVILAWGLAKKNIRPQDAAKIIGVFTCVLLTTLPFYEGTLGFVIRQYKENTGGLNTYWTYFQKYFFGQGDLLIDLKLAAENTFEQMGFDSKEEAIKNMNWPSFAKDFFLSGSGFVSLVVLVANLTAGFLGLYFITPIEGLNLPVQLIWALIITCFFLLIAFSQYHSLKEDKKNKSYKFILIYLITLLAVGGLFILKKQLWSFGKALTFISPFLFTLICWPYLKDKSRLRYIPLVFLFLQFGLGFYRPLAAMNSNGIHYKYPPYPSVHDGARPVKENYDLTLSHIRENLHDCYNVLVSIENLWAREHVFYYLASEGVDFFTNGIIWSYVDAGKKWGLMKQQKHDCLIDNDLKIIKVR